MCVNDPECHFNVSPARLARLVQEYRLKHLPRAKEERAFFKTSTREKALEHAGLAIWKDGKRFRHQNLIVRGALPKARRALENIKGKLDGVEDFDALHELIERTVGRIKGIGELYIYDTALRLGAQLGRRPRRVYLHAGPRNGARSLGCIDYRAKAVAVEKFPPELQELSADQIENFLCVMRREFHG